MNETQRLQSALTGLEDRVGTIIERLTSIESADVFGEPVESGDVVVVTAAEVSRGGGFGFGGGGEEGERGFEGGLGSGGGGGASGRPVAIIEITPEGARIKPIFDLTKIGLAVLAATLTVWRATRRRAR